MNDPLISLIISIKLTGSDEFLGAILRRDMHTLVRKPQNMWTNWLVNTQSIFVNHF